MAYSGQSDMWWGFVSALSAADADNGDYYVLKLALSVGTYEWTMNYGSGADRAKVELWVNDTKVSGATPFDMWQSTATSNNKWTVQNIEIPKFGVHDFRVIVNGKTGGDYRVGASFVTVRRTG